MKERGILFSAPMVRALLAGTKTQTRRIVQPSPGRQREWLTHELIQQVPHGEMTNGGWQMHHPLAGKTHNGVANAHDSPLGWVRCPYGVAGSRLWVRETWHDDWGGANAEARARDEDGNVEAIEYRASHDCRNWEAGCPCNPDGNGKRSEWRPSIFMFRWASRITLEVTGVRVERVQSITEADAKAEGVDDRLGYGLHPYRDAYAKLWDQINDGDGKRWGDSPWVWALEFRMVHP